MTPLVSENNLSLDGVPLEHCIFDETTYSNPSDLDAQNVGRAILGARDAIVVIPRNPLLRGLNYSISITSNGITYAWSFTISDDVILTNIDPKDQMR
jgi:hypothetical protein